MNVEDNVLVLQVLLTSHPLGRLSCFWNLHLIAQGCATEPTGAWIGEVQQALYSSVPDPDIGISCHATLRKGLEGNGAGATGRTNFYSFNEDSAYSMLEKSALRIHECQTTYGYHIF